MAKHKHVNELNPFGFHEVEVALSDIKKHEANPRKISKRDQNELRTSLEKFGLLDKPILNADFTLIAGHQRIDILAQKEIKRVKVMMPEIPLNEAQVLELLIRHNKNTGEWDFDKIALLDVEQLVQFGWDYSELSKIVEQQSEEQSLEHEEPEYPITPRMSEKHSYVLIMVDNDMEKAHLETILNLKTQQDYKSSKIGTGRVLTFADFKESLDSYVKEKSNVNAK